MKPALPALGIYLMAGEGFPEAAEAAVSGGATMFEVGIPYSDGLADGPVIQRAAQAALAAGMTTRRCLEAMAAARERLGPGVPLVPMTYAAIVGRHGPEAFCSEAAAAGAEALIVPDVPPEESEELRAAAAAHDVDVVHLVSLTSTEERIALACRASRGFVYVVSAIGTTGAREELDEARLAALLARVREHAGSLPLLCGFGISSAAQVARVRAAGADGVIVGSAAVAAVDAGGPGALEELVRELASGLRA